MAQLICGVDEAGRGPLAGAVYAAAVILNPEHPILGLADSKKLSEKKRDVLSAEIKQHSLAWAIVPMRYFLPPSETSWNRASYWCRSLRWVELYR